MGFGRYLLFGCGQVGMMMLARFFFSWSLAYADTRDGGGEVLFAAAVDSSGPEERPTATSLPSTGEEMASSPGPSPWVDAVKAALPSPCKPNGGDLEVLFATAVDLSGREERPTMTSLSEQMDLA